MFTQVAHLFPLQLVRLVVRFVVVRDVVVV